jgi:uncharacterized protein YndB with AHSA1/START domain
LGQKEAGLTKTAGYEIGVRRTLDLPIDKAWDYVFGGAGLARWLGNVVQGAFAPGHGFLLDDGTEGRVTVWTQLSHIRLQWRKQGWENTSIVQVRILTAAGNKTTVSFHQEKLADANQRAQMKAYWQEKINNLLEGLKK